MGFRFRKSFGKGPFKMTISKSGISTSVGVKGARITKRADGKTQSTFSIPNTGISYTSVSSKKSNINTNKSSSNINIDKSFNDSKNFFYKFFRICSILMIICSLFAILVMPIYGLISLGIGIFEWILSNYFKGK